MPEWSSIVATAILPLVGIAFLWTLGALCLDLRKKHYSMAIDRMIELLTSLYFIGVALKISGLGPDFGRYHLADIGFPVVLIAAAGLFLEYWRRYEDRSTQLKDLQSDMKYAKNRLKLVPVAFGLSVVYELFAAYLHRTSPTPVLNVGDFDWIDIAMYAFGSAAVALLLAWKVKLHRDYFDALRELEEAERQKQAPKAASKSRKKKRRVKKGVR